MKGTAQQTSNFERTVFDPGTYEMTLTKALVMWGKATQYAPEGAPKIMFIWEYAVGEEKWELVDYLTFPKNFAYNDKSNFWKRVGEIAGVKINSENADAVDIDLGDFIQSYSELVEYIKTKNDKGGMEKAEVKGLTVGEQQLMGKKCQLVVKVWTGDDGSTGNEIAAVMQIGGGSGPRTPQKKAAQPAPTQAAAPAQKAPPARPAMPAPAPTAEVAEADLPF